MLWKNPSGSRLGVNLEKGSTKERDKIRNSWASEFQISKFSLNVEDQCRNYQHLRSHGGKETEQTTSKENMN